MPAMLKINYKCKKCQVTATVKIFSDNGKEIGQFCRQHGAEELFRIRKPMTGRDADKDETYPYSKGSSETGDGHF